MTGGARRFGRAAVLGLGFGLAGCAEGAPGSVVPAPVEGGQVALAPLLTPIAVSDGPAMAPVDDAAAEVVAAQSAATGATSNPAPVAADPAARVAPASAGDGDAVPVAADADLVAAATDRAASDDTPPGTDLAPAFATALDPAVATNPSAAPSASLAAPPTADGAAVAVAPAGQEAGRPPAPPADGSGVSQLIEGHADGRKEVALTFDAGADRGYAEAILDLLQEEGIKATFGMTGSWAELNPDLIQRMVAEGHQLINHTWSHGSMTGANTGQPAWTYEQLADELARTEQIVRDLSGYELKPYYRPPFGDYDLTSLGYLADLGYQYTIMWTCDSQGWRGWGAEQILEYCTQVPLEDDIILMHVGASAAGDYEVLPSMIGWYRANGYAFVTAEEMLQP